MTPDCQEEVWAWGQGHSPRQTGWPFHTPRSQPICLSLAKGPPRVEKRPEGQIYHCKHLKAESQRPRGGSTEQITLGANCTPLSRVPPGAPTGRDSCRRLWGGKCSGILSPTGESPSRRTSPG